MQIGAAWIPLALLFLCGARCHEITPDIDPAVPAEWHDAIRYAARRVSAHLLLDVDLPALVTVDPSPPDGALARTTERYGYCSMGTENGVQSVFALAQLRVRGSPKCNVSEARHMCKIAVDPDLRWFTGTTAHPGDDEYDLVSVMMHEFVHCLGMNPFVVTVAAPPGSTSTAIVTTSFASFARTRDGARPAGQYESTFFVVDGEFRDDMEMDAAGHWADGVRVPPACLPDDPWNPFDNDNPGQLLWCNRLMHKDKPRGTAIHFLGNNTLAVLRALGFAVRDCGSYTGCEACAAAACEWCHSEGKCGDRTGGDECSEENQWVRDAQYCDAGNPVCRIPRPVFDWDHGLRFSLDCSDAASALGVFFE